MAISVIGYPIECNFCPRCGSPNVSVNDGPNDDGEGLCKDCGASWIAIESDRGGTV